MRTFVFAAPAGPSRGPPRRHNRINSGAMLPKTLYVLRLEGNRWYVGTTSLPAQQRLRAHTRGTGSAWTRAHRVERMVSAESVPAATAGLLETAKTLELMKRHGVSKVRGGSYSRVVLDDGQIEDIERHLRHNDSACLRCGRTGHFAARCYARTDARGVPIDDTSTEGESDSDSGPQSGACYRCGRQGHFAADCFARADVSGRRI